MGLILIAVALCILTYFLVSVFDVFSSSEGLALWLTIVIIACLVLVPCGIFTAPAGYENPQLVREVRLASSNDASKLNYQGKESYVIVNLVSSSVKYGDTYEYIFYYEVPSSFSNNTAKVYNCETINSQNVTIIENSSYLAVMQEYVTRAKPSFWGFGVGSREIHEYIFNVPKNSIVIQMEASE